MRLKFKRSNSILSKKRVKGIHRYRNLSYKKEYTDNIDNMIKRNEENIYSIIDRFTSRFIY